MAVPRRRRPAPPGRITSPGSAARPGPDRDARARSDTIDSCGRTCTGAGRLLGIAGVVLVLTLVAVLVVVPHVLAMGDDGCGMGP
jgi:hypothetical protein